MELPRDRMPLQARSRYEQLFGIVAAPGLVLTTLLNARVFGHARKVNIILALYLVQALLQ